MPLARTRIGVSIVAGLASWVLLSAQQSDVSSDTGVPRIGYLGLRPLTESGAPIAALKNGLRDLGYAEGKHYVFDLRLADNDPSRYPELIAELTRLRVKLIVAASTPAAVAIQKANPTMPIVVRGPDIVGAGLAESVSHPGGVATGVDELAAGLSERRLRLLKQAVPSISRVAVLSSAPTEGGHRTAFAEAEQAATAVGIAVRVFRVSATTNFEPLFADLARDGVDAVFCSGGVLPRPVQQRIVEVVTQHRLPAMYPVRDYVDLGGLISYAYRNAEMFRVGATFVDKILKGANAGDLPLIIWDRHYLTVNVRAAAALGITLPPALLSRADEVVK